MTDTQIPDKHDESEMLAEIEKIVTTENQEEKKEVLTTLPGEHLHRVREENKMSVKQVADSLHLEVRIIETLENDDYESGIPSIFMKGYIRNYAKLMGIDPEPLIVAFDNKEQPEEKQSKSANKQAQLKPKKQAKSNDFWPKIVTIIIVLTLIIFIALWQFSPSNDEVVPDEDMAKFNNSSWTPPSIDETTPTTSPERTAVEQPMTTPNQPTPPPVAAPVEEPKDHSIHLTFKAKVWIRITDNTGKRLFQGTAKEGKSLVFEGTPPYKLRVGNDKDIDIEYQGNTKDIKDYPKYKNKRKTFIIGGE
jgi:cytoskeleton protein RodZ